MSMHGSVDESSLGAAHPGVWRIPLAMALALVSIPLAFWYGYGVIAAGASLVVLWPVWRSGQSSPAVWVAGIIGVIGLGLGAFMLVAAVGLCGIGVFVGRCNA